MKNKTMSTRLKSIRPKYKKRILLTSNLKNYLLNDKNYKLIKSVSKNISSKIKLETEDFLETIPKSFRYHQLAKILFNLNKERNLIKDVFDERSPINSRAIAIKLALSRFYEKRDLTLSLNTKEHTKVKSFTKI